MSRGDSWWSFARGFVGGVSDALKFVTCGAAVNPMIVALQNAKIREVNAYPDRVAFGDAARAVWSEGAYFRGFGHEMVHRQSLLFVVGPFMARAQSEVRDAEGVDAARKIVLNAGKLSAIEVCVGPFFEVPKILRNNGVDRSFTAMAEGGWRAAKFAAARNGVTYAVALGADKFKYDNGLGVFWGAAVAGGVGASASMVTAPLDKGVSLSVLRESGVSYSDILKQRGVFAGWKPRAGQQALWALAMYGGMQWCSSRE